MGTLPRPGKKSQQMAWYTFSPGKIDTSLIINKQTLPCLGNMPADFITLTSGLYYEWFTIVNLQL
jgi:hypothetical protein